MDTNFKRRFLDSVLICTTLTSFSIDVFDQRTVSFANFRPSWGPHSYATKEQQNPRPIITKYKANIDAATCKKKGCAIK